MKPLLLAVLILLTSCASHQNDKKDEPVHQNTDCCNFGSAGFR